MVTAWSRLANAREEHTRGQEDTWNTLVWIQMLHIQNRESYCRRELWWITTSLCNVSSVYRNRQRSASSGDPCAKFPVRPETRRSSSVGAMICGRATRPDFMASSPTWALAEICDQGSRNQTVKDLMFSLQTQTEIELHWVWWHHARFMSVCSFQDVVQALILLLWPTGATSRCRPTIGDCPDSTISHSPEDSHKCMIVRVDTSPMSTPLNHPWSFSG